MFPPITPQSEVSRFATTIQRLEQEAAQYARDERADRLRRLAGYRQKLAMLLSRKATELASPPVVEPNGVERSRA